MFRKPKSNTSLENAIDTALIEITGRDPSTTEFITSVDQIAKLHKMKVSEKPSALSRDTILLCVTNVAAIILIIRHEEFNNITSKALGFVPKLKP